MSNDQKLFATEQPINLKHYQRLLKEVKEVNQEFISLRTYVFPDPADHLNLFYYVMFPNDGVMSQMPIIGRLIIPPTYPKDPPVLHKFTRTGRYNADVYDSYLDRPESMHSTMCFDILRPRSDHSTSWRETYTLSALFATLMQALVSMYVEQDYGGNHTEFVTMEKLDTMKANCQRALEQWKDVFDPQTFPEIPRFEAMAIPECQKFDFGTDVIKSNNNNQPLIVSSQPIDLQKLKDNYTVGFDLSQLTPSYVFSIVLANSKTDMTGKKPDTILVRNGVTASAAKKRWNQKINWFYHGKPMNDGNMILYVTVTNDQFTISYLDGDGKVIVHGDCPVSYLTEKSIGDVRFQEGPFYLNIFLKKKSGPGGIEIPIIPGVKGPDVGFIHDPQHINIELPSKPEIKEPLDV